MNFAPDDNTLEPDPTWVRLDDDDNFVASYTIDRGRQFELDRTDGGRATVAINDRDGVLDPTNGGGLYAGALNPLIQITLGRYNPVLAEWQTRWRGFISDYDYVFDPSQRVNRLVLSCVDLFEIMQAIEMLPGQFGNDPTTDAPLSIGQVWFADADVGVRINQVYGNAGLPSDFFVTFTGNVGLCEATYAPGESAMTAVQECVDAEFPGVSNLYPDRFGRLVFHGRLAKFDPAAVIGGGPVPDSTWDWHHWHCGDGAAVAAAPTTVAQIREFAFNRGYGQIINSPYATPMINSVTNQLFSDADVAGQLITPDPTSVAKYGIRSWSAQNLLTKTGLLDGSSSLVETKRFAQWRMDNYATPRNRVTRLVLRSMAPDWPGAAITWRQICESDISDQLDVTVDSPGGGGFGAEPFYIEGMHEESRPLNPDYDDHTIAYDVSPAGLYADAENRFPTS